MQASWYPDVGAGLPREKTRTIFLGDFSRGKPAPTLGNRTLIRVFTRSVPRRATSISLPATASAFDPTGATEQNVRAAFSMHATNSAFRRHATAPAARSIFRPLRR